MKPGRLATAGIGALAATAMAAALMAGCGPRVAPTPAAMLVGTWVRPVRGARDRTEGIVLGEDGSLGLIGIHSMHGLFWELPGADAEAERLGRRLLLATNTGRYPSPETWAARIWRLDSDHLELRSEAGYLAGSWRRDQAAAGRIDGTASFALTGPLPADSALHLELDDASGAGAAVAFAALPLLGRQSPVAFSMAYATADIDPHRPYVLRAWLAGGGRELARAELAVPVLTRGALKTADLRLVAAGR
jgi:uncharacterized lipoprotein YbaY